MKKILLFLALVLFWQLNHLDAMHPLGVGHKSNRHVDKLANLRIHIKKEAQEAADAIQEWLTPELARKLLLPSNDDQNPDAVQLNTEILRKLPIGQQIVLTQWRMYPHYAALIFNEFEPQRISAFIRDLHDPFMFLRFALVEYNFGKKVLDKLKMLAENDFASLSRLRELIPQLKELKDLSKQMSSLQFKKEVAKYDEDLRDCLFALQYPCFVPEFIRICANNKHYDVIKLFLEYGLNPNSPLPDGRRNNVLLKIAVAHGHFDGTLLLLTHQADPLYSKEGPSSMAMSLKKLQGSYDLSEEVRDIHTILSLSVSEEALNQCQFDVLGSSAN